MGVCLVCIYLLFIHTFRQNNLDIQLEIFRMYKGISMRECD